MDAEKELKKHIKDKKQVLEDLGVPEIEIWAIPWHTFKTVSQVDNYCRPVINNHLKDR